MKKILLGLVLLLTTATMSAQLALKQEHHFDGRLNFCNKLYVIYSKFFITFAVDLHLKYGLRPSLSLVETCQQRSVPILYTSKNWIVRWAMTPYL